MRSGPPAFDHLWRRLPRFLAGGVGAAAALSPARTVAVLAMTLGFGTSAFVAVASVGDGEQQAASPTTLGVRPAPSVSRGETERPDVTGAGGSVTQPGESVPSVSQAPQARSKGHRNVRTPAASRGPGASVSHPDGSAAPPAESSPSASPSDPGAEQPGAEESGTSQEEGGAPETSVSARFPGPDGAVFSFSADEPASYACSLDGAAYTPCDSPTSFSGLHPGWHVFAVRATDEAGNADPTPAVVHWHANAGSEGDRGRS
jgi:hypothetical protein